MVGSVGAGVVTSVGNGVVTSVGGWCQKMGLCGRGVYGGNGDVVRKERSRDGFSGSLLGCFMSS